MDYLYIFIITFNGVDYLTPPRPILALAVALGFAPINLAYWAE